MERDSKTKIYTVANKILYKLNAISGTPQGKAYLAKLRNSIGKELSETIEVWPIFFEYLPEDFLGTDNLVSYEEKAILTALQLYALHQQGVSKTVLLEGEDNYKNIGYALRYMRRVEDTKSSDRRFNTMICASTFDELTYHLRHLIKILKVRSPEARINYAKLAEDLYWYQRGYYEKLRLSWSRAYYYKETYKGEGNNEK